MNYYENFDDCATAMIDSIKGIIYDRHNDIFDRIDFYDDNIFFEPLIYTYLKQPENKWLDSIIFAYEKEKKHTIQVFSNSEGVIFIPHIGYFKTNHSNACFNLNNSGDQYWLRQGNIDIPYVFESIIYTSEGFELMLHLHPLQEHYFRIDESLSTQHKLPKNYLKELDEGLTILKSVNNDFYKILTKCLKRIVLFNATEPNSFAVFESHNMVFLNVNSWDAEMFFVDHLSHEGAHVVFNTLTYFSKLKLFKFPYTTSFSEASGRKDEHSTVYLRFHGLFTFIEIIKSLKEAISFAQLSAKNKREAEGRLVFQLKRFETSLKSFEDLDIFLPEGLLWYNYFKSQYLLLNNEFCLLRTKFNLLKQSYDFNAEVFLRLNPA